MLSVPKLTMATCTSSCPISVTFHGGFVTELCYYILFASSVDDCHFFDFLTEHSGSPSSMSSFRIGWILNALYSSMASNYSHSMPIQVLMNECAQMTANISRSVIPSCALLVPGHNLHRKWGMATCLLDFVIALFPVPQLKHQSHLNWYQLKLGFLINDPSTDGMQLHNFLVQLSYLPL